MSRSRKADVPAPPGPADRPLAGLERAMCITDEHTPFNVVAVLRIEGELPAAAVRGALDRLRQRHRLLRAGIVKDGGGYAFRFEVAGPIPLETRERPAGDGWIEAAQDELARRLDLASGPLARCLYLRGPGGGDLIVTLHHAILDAASAVHLFGELLALCAGATPPGDGALLSAEGAVAPTELYPDGYKGLGFARATTAYMAGQVADEAQFRWRSRGARTPPIADAARCCFLPVRFPAALSAALLEASRRRRVTLNAILSAGMMLAVQRRLYPMKRQPARVPLRHVVFADLRSRLRTPVPDAVLGCLLTMFRFTVQVGVEGGFWAVAREIQERTRAAGRSGERYLAYSLSPGMMQALFKLKAFRMGATALSYSGPLAVPTSFGSFEVTAVHAFPANMPVGPEYSALVRLFRGELCWDIAYLDSDMDEATAREIAADMQALLAEAAC